MPMVNQFQGYGGNPGYGNWPVLTQPFTAEIEFCNHLKQSFTDRMQLG